MTAIISSLPSFQNYLRHERGLTEATITSYTSDLRVLSRAVGDEIESITLDRLRAYQRELSEKGLKQATIERKFACFSTFWKWLTLEKLATENLTDSITIPKRKRRLPRWLEADQLKRFVETPDQNHIKHLARRNQLAWLLMATMGLRRSEILNLRVEHILKEDRLLMIRQGKGGVDRSIPIPEIVLDRLLTAIEGKATHEWVMPGRYKGKWNPKQFTANFHRQVKAAGLPKWVKPHTIRHSYATNAIKRGVSIFNLAKLMGHKDIKATMVYLHALPKDLRWSAEQHVLAT